MHYDFSSKLTLLASVYCKKWEKRLLFLIFHFGNFLSVFIQNAKFSGAECNTQTFIKFQIILYFSNLDLIQSLPTALEF
jgi:hypothetical protein